MPIINRQANRPGNQTTMRKSVVNRIKSIGFDSSDGIKIMLYGRSGTGKTTLWSTFPGPILVAVCSGGDRPGELRSIDTEENREKIQQVVLRQSSELGELVDYVKTDGGRNFGTVVLDHATGFQDMVFKEVLGLDEVPVEKSWGMATQQQYGQTGVQCKEAFRKLLGLSCNVVIIAQEKEFNTDNNHNVLLPYVGAGMIPSLTGWVNTAVDYIAQTFIKQKEVVKKRIAGEGNAKRVIERLEKVKGVDYCLRVGPDAVFTTKFRVPDRGLGLVEPIINPTYAKIMGLVRVKSGDQRNPPSAETKERMNGPR